MTAIHFEIRGPIAFLTLQHPPANALNYLIYQELYDHFQRIDTDKNILITIIQAKGRFFSAGNDINEFAHPPQFKPGDIPHDQLLEESLSSIIRSPKPVISLVQGYALGSGFCLVSYSDIAVATPNARFGIPEIKRGIIGGAPEASFSLPPKLVRYLALTGEPLTAEEAYRAGLIVKIVPEEALLETGLQIAEQILSNPPISVQFMKQSLAAIYPPTHIADLIAGDEDRNTASQQTQDFQEAVHSFLEKRPPRYIGQ